jgi:P-type Ca2+ transporter type 2C
MAKSHRCSRPATWSSPGLAGVLGLDETGDALAVPLLATQILWINLLTDTAPALAMGLDPP